MKITADATRHHIRQHILYDGKCNCVHRNGEFLVYAYTDVLQSSLNGKFAIQVTLSLEELNRIQAAEIAALRAAIARLEKKVEVY